MKAKFVVGERVLCFEPDKTKARVLYDAKILDADVVRDGKLKKEPEYKIHFQGWNSAWDRWADESFVLKNTEENKKLQRKLARKAIQQLKVHGRKKVHLPGVASVLKKSNSQDDSSDSDCSIDSDRLKLLIPDELAESDSSCNSPIIKRRRKTSTPAGQKGDDAPSCSNDSSVHDGITDLTTIISTPLPRKVAQVEIPPSLLKRLEEDSILVTKRNMHVQLPAKLNIVQILENYVKYFALNVAQLPSSDKHLKTTQASTDIPPPEKNIQLCKETCEELRILFDFILPIVLLYNCEQTQCKNVMINSHIKSNEEVLDTNCTTKTPTKDTVEVKSVRHTPVKKKLFESDSCTATPTSPESTGRAPTKPVKSRKKTAEEQIIEETHTYLIPGQPKLDRTGLGNDTQGRRRSSRLSHHLYSPERSFDEMQISPPISPEGIQGSSEDPKKERVENFYVNVETIVFLRAPQNHQHGMLNQERNVNSPLPLLCNQHDRYSCTSDLISSTEMCQEAFVGSARNDVKRAVQLSQVWKWKLVPCDYRPPDSAYVPCSFVYGIHHFLRLFVKLPSVLSRMSIPDNKMKVIIRHIHQMLKFIAEYEREIFAFGGYTENALTTPRRKYS